MILSDRDVVSLDMLLLFSYDGFMRGPCSDELFPAKILFFKNYFVLLFVIEDLCFAYIGLS